MSSDIKFPPYDNSIQLHPGNRGTLVIDVFWNENQMLRANDEVLLFDSFCLIFLCKFRPLLPSFLRFRLVISVEASLWIHSQLFVIGNSRGGGYLTKFWTGTCHRSFKNIPVPYTNFSKVDTRLYTNFSKIYTRLYTNFPKIHTRPYTNCENCEN